MAINDCSILQCPLVTCSRN